MNRLGQEVRLGRAVVAAQAADGTVVYQYGWVGVDGIETTMDRERPEDLRAWASYRLPDPDYATTVNWAAPPTWTMRYPTDADFAEQLGQARGALAAAGSRFSADGVST